MSSGCNIAELDKYLHKLLEPLRYDDGGAGVHNAAVLRKAGVRPAFIDVSAVVYRCMFAKASTYCKISDDDTTVAHCIAADSLKDIADACKQFKCAPILCFDSKVNFRREIFTEYKAGRGESKKTAAEERVVSLIDKVSLLLRRVYAPGYNIQAHLMYGYESDDVIAAFVLGLKQADDFIGEPAFTKEIVIVSGDHDLHQLMLDKVFFADVRGGVLLSAKDVAKKWIHPSEVVAHKTVGGCKSDAVPGVRFFGDKTTAQVVSERTFSAATYHGAVKQLENPQDVMETLVRNKQLVRLPLHIDAAMPSLWLNADTFPEYGIPDEMLELMENIGVPEEMRPVFGESDLNVSMSPIPMVKRKDGRGGRCSKSNRKLRRRR